MKRINKSIFKRSAMIALSFCLSIALTMGNLQVGYASKPETTDDKVIEISSAEELAGISKNLEGTYVLTKDIYLSELDSWSPIGAGLSASFCGKLDGQGHRIVGLNISYAFNSGTIMPPRYSVGLFGVCDGAEIKNVIFEQADVSIETTSGYRYTTNIDDEYAVYAGVIAGYACNGTKISNCRTSGKVIAKASGEGYSPSVAGGLIGAGKEVSITDCVNSCSVEAHNGNAVQAFDAYAGGVAGRIINSANIERTCNKGEISSQTLDYGNSYAGGFIGGGHSASVKITDCFNKGNVISQAGNLFSDSAYAGGIAAGFSGTCKNVYDSGEIRSSVKDPYGINSNAFSYAGGICGNCEDGAEITDAAIVQSVVSAGTEGNKKQYRIASGGKKHNTITINMAASGSVNDAEYVKTVSEMKTKQPYTDILKWDFVNVWEMLEDSEFPQLRQVELSDDVIIDYNKGLSEYFMEQDPRSTIHYLCTDGNFPASVFMKQNDMTFSDNISMFFSDAIFRGEEGRKDLFNAETSTEDAKRIIAALLEVQQKSCEQLAVAKVSKKYAKEYVSGLKEFLAVDSLCQTLTNNEIEVINEAFSEEKIAELLIKGNFENATDILIEGYGYSADSSIVKVIKKYQSSSVAAKSLSKGLTWLGKGLKLVSVTQSTFNNLHYLEVLKETDEIYCDMLRYLNNNCPYAIVRDAAGSLYSIINDEYKEKLKFVFKSLNDAEEAEIINKILDTAISEISYAMIIKKVFDLGISLVNAVFHIDDIQKLKDNIRALTYISFTLSQWTIERHKAYLDAYEAGEENAKQSSARELYYSLSMLWHSRYEAEYSLRKLLSYGNINRNSKWSEYSLMTSDTLYSFKDRMFSEGMKKKLVTTMIACPVDVDVYDKNNKLIVTIQDGQETEGRNGEVSYYSHKLMDEDYEKVVVCPEKDGYSIKCRGNNLGKVDSCITKNSNEGITNWLYADNISVDKGTDLEVMNDESIPMIKVTGNSGEKMINLSESKDAYVQATKIDLSTDEMALTEGEKAMLDALFAPANASLQHVKWESSKEDVAKVNNDGVVTAEGPGTAIIKAVSADNEKLTAECKIVVKELNKPIGEDDSAPANLEDEQTGKEAEGNGPTANKVKKINTDKKYSITNSSIRNYCNTKKLEITFKWSAVKGANDYKTAYRSAASKKWTESWTKGKITFAVKKLKKNGLYEFRVMAYKKNGNIWQKGPWSSMTRIWFMPVSSPKYKSGKKSIHVKWNKTKGATGYEIRYSFKKNMTKAKVFKVKKGGITKAKISKLKKGKRYYIQIRPVRKYKSMVYPGIFSKVKAVKTKW